MVQTQTVEHRAFIPAELVHAPQAYIFASQGESWEDGALPAVDTIKDFHGLQTLTYLPAGALNCCENYRAKLDLVPHEEAETIKYVSESEAQVNEHKGTPLLSLANMTLSRVVVTEFKYRSQDAMPQTKFLGGKIYTKDGEEVNLLSIDFCKEIILLLDDLERTGDRMNWGSAWMRRAAPMYKEIQRIGPDRQAFSREIARMAVVLGVHLTKLPSKKAVLV